ncbi:putative RING-H2 finger protein ATL69 [Typha latifolia]|uniref:putative RING-H2 finger protein ATL69 n=1 Tax=Typha latifolia TaxID=4733 RepID=UPI003C2F0E16
MLGSGLNLVSTVIGFGMSATFIVFVCARLICGRIRSNESRAAPFDIELQSDLDEPSEHAISGLEPVAVAAIPKMKYNRDAFRSKEDAQCSICLGEYEEKEMLRIMPTCRHNFHLACIDEWLQKQPTCPICRLPLGDIFEAKYASASALRASDGQSNQWLHPSHVRSEGREDSHIRHESVSVVVPVPQEIQESRR